MPSPVSTPVPVSVSSLYVEKLTANLLPPEVAGLAGDGAEAAARGWRACPAPAAARRPRRGPRDPPRARRRCPVPTATAWRPPARPPAARRARPGRQKALALGRRRIELAVGEDILALRVNACAPRRWASAAAAASSCTRTSPNSTEPRLELAAHKRRQRLAATLPDSGSTCPSFCVSASHASRPSAVVRPASSCSAVRRMRSANESAAAPSTLVSCARSALPSSSLTNASTSFLAHPARRRRCRGSLRRRRAAAAASSQRTPERRAHYAVRARSRAKRSPGDRTDASQHAMHVALGRLRRRARPPRPRRRATLLRGVDGLVHGTNGSPPPAPTNTSLPTVNAGVPSRAVSASTAGPETSTPRPRATRRAPLRPRRACPTARPRGRPARHEHFGPHARRQPRSEITNQLDVRAPPLGGRYAVTQQRRQRQRIGAAIEQQRPDRRKRAAASSATSTSRRFCAGSAFEAGWRGDIVIEESLGPEAPRSPMVIVHIMEKLLESVNRRMNK